MSNVADVATNAASREAEEMALEKWKGDNGEEAAWRGRVCFRVGDVRCSSAARHFEPVAASVPMSP
jgi:hypothetical protein